MNFIPPDFGRVPGKDTASPDRADSFELRWAALSQAAAVVSALVPGIGIADAMLTMPPTLRGLEGTRRRLVEEGLGDLIAVMGPGVEALLTLHRAGGDARVPAQALWREFLSARRGLLALAGAGAGND